MNRRVVSLILALAVSSSLAACSSLDLGPDPSTRIQSSGQGSSALTDPELQAVVPVVAGDSESGHREYGAAMLPGGGANAQTMPAATQPTTTRPASSTNPSTQSGLGQGAASTRPQADATTQINRSSVPDVLSVQDAILLGLQNNTNLRVQKANVPIQRTAELSALGQFDTTLNGTLQGGRTGATTQPFTPIRGTSYTDQIDAQIGVSQFLPTGTTINGGYSTNNFFFTDEQQSTSELSLSVTQSLLRGAGLDVNLATLRQAEIDTKVTQYELRGIAEDLIATIEETYWDLAYAERAVLIVQNAVNVAQEQLDSTNKQIAAGRVAESERAAAVAEVELQKENLINAKSTLEQTRIRFLQTLTPAKQAFWNERVSLKTFPFVPTGKMDSVDKHVDVALRMRPELNEAKLELQRGDLQIVKTKNGLLPQLDLFLNLNKTGYSSSFGNSNNRVLDGSDYEAIGGVTGSFPLQNSVARAAYRAAQLTRQQSQDSLDNLEQTVQVDVRTQYIEVERTRQQIEATRATRAAQQEAFTVEQAKFKEGRSTSLLVNQAQRDLLSAQLAEVQAVTNHLNALVELYRLEGSLLYRRGIDAPGASPVTTLAWH